MTETTTDLSKSDGAERRGSAEAPPVPKGLKEAGLALWHALAPPRYILRPDEIKILEMACREADLLTRIEKELDLSELEVTGRGGETKPAPLLVEVRQHYANLTTMLRALKIPDSPGSATRISNHTSEQARQAIRARWERRLQA